MERSSGLPQQREVGRPAPRPALPGAARGACTKLLSPGAQGVSPSPLPGSPRGGSSFEHSQLPATL